MKEGEELRVGREGGEEAVRGTGVIGCRGVEEAAVVGEAVGDHEAGGAVDEVVAGDLVEDALGDGDGGGFVFDDYEWAEAFAGEDDGVAAAEGAVEAQ